MSFSPRGGGVEEYGSRDWKLHANTEGDFSGWLLHPDLGAHVARGEHRPRPLQALSLATHRGRSWDTPPRTTHQP